MVDGADADPRAQALRFYDTTLRDGLRNSGVELSLDERIAVAAALEAAGVDAVEIGYGGPDQVSVMRAIAETLDRAVVCGLSRTHLRDVDRVLTGVEPAARRGVNVYLPCSDPFLAAAGTSREDGLAGLVRAIAHARPHVDDVVFGTQDASRADPSFLVEVCGAAVEAGATVVSISDTVSHALPWEFAALCEALRAAVPAHGTTWSVHCHQGLGVGVANCLAAIAVGVGQVEGTLGGIGEGAGNVALDAVARAVAARSDALPGVTLAVDVERLSRAATRVAGRPIDGAVGPAASAAAPAG